MPEMTIATATGSLSLGYCNNEREKGEKEKGYIMVKNLLINNDHMLVRDLLVLKIRLLCKNRVPRS